MIWLFLFAALLCLTAVHAASICDQATATISSQADASLYTACATLSGSVIIDSTAAGKIALDGPNLIDGDLIVSGADELTSLTSATIGQIKGNFTLDTLVALSTLQFTSLTAVAIIAWSTLPNLQEIAFPTGPIVSQSITITNTGITVLENFVEGSIATLDINNNPLLGNANFTVDNIMSSLILDANNNLAVYSFPNLIWAANFTASNCSQLNVPSLTVVNGSMGLSGNSFASFSAPALTAVGNVASGEGSVDFDSNFAMASLSMPQLETVGGALTITNNVKLATISLPAVAQVGDSIQFIGSFSAPSLPVLENVRGNFDVESTNTLNCGALWDKIGTIVQGIFSCQEPENDGSAGLSSPTSTSTSSASTSTSSYSSSTSSNSGTRPSHSSTPNKSPSAHSGLSTGAKIGIGVTLPLVAIIVVLMAFAWKRGYKLSLRRNVKLQLMGLPHPREAELPLGGHHEQTELPVKENPGELSGTSTGPVPEAHELYASERHE
ncbi:hypothetical protein N431DRAFT_391377, partial [Stipitochalara longipes BDJ]